MSSRALRLTKPYTRLRTSKIGTMGNPRAPRFGTENLISKTFRVDLTSTRMCSRLRTMKRVEV